MWKRVWEGVGSTGVDRAVGVWVVMSFGYEVLWEWGVGEFEYWFQAGDLAVFLLGCGLLVTRWLRLGAVVGLLGVLGLEWWATLTGWVSTQQWTTWAKWVSYLVWESLPSLGAVVVLVWPGVVVSVSATRLGTGGMVREVETRSLNYSRGEAWGGFEKWLVVWVMVWCAVLGFGEAMRVLESGMSVGDFAQALRLLSRDALAPVGAVVGMGIAGVCLITRRGTGWAVVAMGVVVGVLAGTFARVMLRPGWVGAGTLEFLLRVGVLIAPGVLVGMLWWESRRRGR